VNKYGIYVESIEDHEDGSATISFEVGLETLKMFASIGIQQVLLETAKDILNGHSDPEGTADADSGEAGGTDFHEQFPGL
jgi:hypothetical protein